MTTPRAAISVGTLLLIALFWVESALGDEIVTTNGDRLSGRILQADQDTVLLQTEYAGIIAIERNRVRSLRRGSVQRRPKVVASCETKPSTGAYGSSPEPPEQAAEQPAPESSGPTLTGSARSSPYTPGSQLSGRVAFALSDDKGNTDKHEIDFDYQAEYRFYDHTDQQYWGSAWSLNYDQLVRRERLQPYHRQFGYVALDGGDKVLWQWWTRLRVPLAAGFTGAIELEYDYDSDPAVEAKTTDTTLRLMLGYAW